MPLIASESESNTGDRPRLVSVISALYVFGGTLGFLSVCAAITTVGNCLPSVSSSTTVLEALPTRVSSSAWFSIWRLEFSSIALRGPPRI